RTRPPSSTVYGSAPPAGGGKPPPFRVRPVQGPCRLCAMGRKYRSPAFKPCCGGAETVSMRLYRRLRAESGESLTKTVLGMMIFLVAAVALSMTLTASVSVHRIARERTTAEQQAQSQIESIRRLPYDSVGIVNGNPSGVLAASSTVTLAGESMTITTSVTYVA